MNEDTSCADACNCRASASRLCRVSKPAHVLPHRYVQYGTHAEAVAARDKSACVPSLAGAAVELRWNDRPYEQVVVVFFYAWHAAMWRIMLWGYWCGADVMAALCGGP